jgi:hypothetical protein
MTADASHRPVTQEHDMANEQKKQTGTTNPANRPNQPGQNPSGGSTGSRPGQQNPGRRSDEWSDRGGSKKTPSDPSRKGGMGDDSDLDTDESDNPA